MKAANAILALLVSFAGVCRLAAANPGDEVIVIYNSRMPESKAVADYYAQKRRVPTNQVFGFDLPTTEDISRRQFRDSLYRPLAKALEKNKLWHIGSVFIGETNGMPSRIEWRPLESRIRYAAVCYGVPLRITEDDTASEAGADKLRPELKRNAAAVDADLALLPLVEYGYPLYGLLPNTLYATTNAALLNPTNGLLLVTRLDGPTPQVARELVDKAIEAETNGLWGRAYLDVRGIKDVGLNLGDDWIKTAAETARFMGFEVMEDTNSATFSASFPMSHIALYAGWYDNDASGPFRLPQVEFMPGAFAYHLHSYSAATLRSTNANWAGPLLAKGVTCTMGCVAEPQLGGTPDVGTFLGRFLVYGFTLGEAAYACQNSLSWQTTVIGDPLYRPFGRPPQELHQELERRGSPLIEWAHLKVVDLNLYKHTPLAAMAGYLEDIPITKQSAVLTEKLGDLYAALGKPASTLRAYRQALKLNPSPQQRIRIRLALGQKLEEQERPDEAVENYQSLLSESPDYPGKSVIVSKLTALQARLQPASTNN